MKLHCLNNISQFGLNLLSKNYEITKDVHESDLILVRSAVMHDMEIPHNLIAVGRAGAGVNNIPLDKFAKAGIVVFNTPGANANGVKELVLAGMLMSVRDIHGGLNWVHNNASDPEIAKTVEKAKAQFGGTEILGKSIGIVGLGAIGILVANACHALGMKVYGFDVYFTEERRHLLPTDFTFCDSLDELYTLSDFITLHVPLTPDTKGMINQETLSLMKDGVVILNYSRDSLVDDDAMEKALQAKKVRKYVTDFPNPRTANMEGVLCIPHLGASTEESEDNCAMMAVRQLMNYAETGSIANSVNFPACDLPLCESDVRLAILHENKPTLLNTLTELISKNPKTKITKLVNNVRGDVAYTVYDIDNASIEEIQKELNSISGIFRIRVIK
ncbi:MAG: 3-phosphoglycerate dehydrogenase [Tenericutes bacterium HGW-Tenericutes-1]|jgi:D-3-phosphoglycerate dehydrogenase|nr:MAG: 3-phosphoglycerate dehydrogenase [Tenericutes bacterium HGW-Tenericutes-1]